MKLVASLIVRNEAHRYLAANLAHLAEFCDEIRVLDDASDDGTPNVLDSNEKVRTLRLDKPGFYEHEGNSRNQLLAWTLKAKPTHVLALDADEFVSDGERLRHACEQTPDVALALCMEEVWSISGNGYVSRQDGGWRAYRGVFAWPVTASTGTLRLMDRKLACGRVPTRAGRRGRINTTLSLLHLGWANASEREARYQRYVEHDGGQFHQSQHLESIMWPEAKMMLRACPIPEGLKDRWEAIGKIANPDGTPRMGVSKLLRRNDDD
jgi:glycosyltransferase involved in cell wall biosynthesis